MEYADFKSWPGISSCGVFARHGFPFNLLISVLVSMTTLFSACSQTFTHGNPKDCGWMKTLHFLLFLLSVGIRFHLVHVYFSYSVSSVWGNADTSIYLDNITRILDRLLDGYDNRLRPGFGGNVMTVSYCISYHFASCRIGQMFLFSF